MTKEEYHRLAPTFDFNRFKADQEIDKLSQKINRTGHYYRSRVREIETKYNLR